MTKTKQNPNLALWFLVFGLVLVFGSLFVSFRATKKFHNQIQVPERQTNVSDIREWMTIKYLSKVYSVPQPYLESALGIEPGQYSKASLQQIAKGKNLNQSDVIHTLQKAISEFQLTHPLPPSNK